MHRCKKEIEDKAQAARCISRVNKVGTVVQKYQRTLSPYDFYLRMEDVCPIPDIRKVIVNGTDEEFNTRIKEVTSELPKLTSRILEERTAKTSALLPFNDRPGGVLSLATAWFSCGLCCRYPTHGTDALIPHCLSLADHPSKQPTGEEAFDSHVQGRGWCADTSMFKFSETASIVARGLILECGEDPESITLAEIYSKFHRFVFYEKGELVAHNWQETVSPIGFSGAYYCGLTIHNFPSSSITNIAIPLCITGFSDQTNAQSLCTIPVVMTVHGYGAVSIAGGIVKTRLPRSQRSPA